MDCVECSADDHHQILLTEIENDRRSKSQTYENIKHTLIKLP